MLRSINIAQERKVPEYGYNENRIKNKDDITYINEVYKFKIILMYPFILLLYFRTQLQT